MSDVQREDTRSSSSTSTSKKLGKKSRSRVSFQGDLHKNDDTTVTRLDMMKAELERMKKRDEETERRRKEMKQAEIKKMKAKLDQEKLDKGIQLHPGVSERKQEISQSLTQETKTSMQDERSKVAAETARLKNEISLKHGLHIKKKKNDVVKLAEEFAKPHKSSNAFGLPDRIVREFTFDEIMDLKKVFDMFDVAGIGYIRRKDVLRIAAMLGLRSTKEVFKEMLDDLCKDHIGKVSFVNFLDFMMKNQEGSDPFEEVQQCFRILDPDDKGYLTFGDIRSAADEADCRLSNRMIREMIDEADTSGDAKVELDEFMLILLRTSAFNIP